MASRTWKGGASLNAQVSTFVVGSNTNTHTFTISVEDPTGANGTSLVQIASATADGVLTTDQIAALLQAAWAASTHDFAKAVTATVASSTITFTANLSGKPFLITKGGTGTSTYTVTSNSRGPDDWNTPSNWVEGVVPVASDVVSIQGSQSIVYGMAQGTVEFDYLYIYNYAGTIGSYGSPLNLDVEFEVSINFSGVAYLRLKGANTVPLVTITDTGSFKGFGVYLDGDASSVITLLNLYGGSTFCGYEGTGLAPTAAQIQTSATARFEGFIPATIKHNGGTSYIHRTIASGTVTLFLAESGNVVFDCASAVTVATNNGANVDILGTGVISTFNANAGLSDFSKNQLAKETTTLVKAAGAQVKFDTAYHSVTTFTRNGGAVLYD